MSDTFDTVMLAVGRHAVTAGIGLEPVGVQVRYFVLVCVCVLEWQLTTFRLCPCTRGNQVAQNGKIVAAADGVLSETSTVDNIFAIGDVLDGRPELTPVRLLEC